MTPRPHIIAAKPPGGMVSQPHDDDRSGSSRAGTNSAGRRGSGKAGHLFNETTRRAIEAKLREGCQTKLREDRHVTVGRWREDLADDWRDFIREVQASPYSHALVAIGAFFAGLLLIVVPAMIGAGVLS